MIVIIANKKRLLGYTAFFVFAVCLFGGLNLYNKSVTSVSGDNKKAYIAIVIDDFGNNSEGTKEMLSLDIKYTGAVMPNMQTTKEECEMLNKAGKDVILHMPMEAHTGKRSWLGPTPILNDMSDSEVLEVFNNCLSQVDYCVGVNNHMGSKIMENERILNDIFNILKEKDYIFVDSMTTAKSVGKDTADKYGIKYIQRDVFLDSTQDISIIEKNMRKTGEIALKKGYAVAIGHVGAEGGKVTAQAIKNTYKELESQGISFITVSELAEKSF